MVHTEFLFEEWYKDRLAHIRTSEATGEAICGPKSAVTVELARRQFSEEFVRGQPTVESHVSFGELASQLIDL